MNPAHSLVLALSSRGMVETCGCIRPLPYWNIHNLYDIWEKILGNNCFVHIQKKYVVLQQKHTKNNICNNALDAVTMGYNGRLLHL